MNFMNAMSAEDVRESQAIWNCKCVLEEIVHY
jgi:hypothetical protein